MLPNRRPDPSARDAPARGPRRSLVVLNDPFTEFTSVRAHPLYHAGMTALRLILVCLGGCLAVSCASPHYDKFEKGTFYGTLTLEWKNDREFIFRQNPKRPFYFERANGERIIPETSYTDGGSIPRALWGFRGYSPWECGPAFIIHDWLFQVQQCKLPGYKPYEFEETAQIMAECIKTLMETEEQPPPSTARPAPTPRRVVAKSPTRLYRMYLAVRSPVARNIWNGRCTPQPPTVEADQQEQTPGELKRNAPKSAPTSF